MDRNNGPGCLLGVETKGIFDMGLELNGWQGKIAGLAMVMIGMGAAADAATYTFVPSVAGGGVTGTIVTDGTIGALATANILDWNLTLNDGVNVFNLIGDGSVGDNSVVLVSGSFFSASVTELMFNFGISGFALFQSPFIGSGQNFLCFDGDRSCTGVGIGVIFNLTQGAVSTPQSGQVVVATAVSAVPLPAALPMMAVALGGLGAFARRKRRA